MFKPSLLFLFLSSTYSKPQPTKHELDTTPTFPLIRLNYSVDPCENLYEHVCSQWKKENPVP
jgi:hypothetical protein